MLLHDFDNYDDHTCFLLEGPCGPAAQFRKQMRDQSGSVLIYIFVGIVLFGGLMFALNRSGQVSTSIATKGLAKASASDLQEYSRMLGSAVDMLLSRGCSQSQISYETPSGLGVNSNAPSDKRCHVFNIAGGNVRYRDLGSSYCVSGKALTDLSIGENCGSFVYAGISGGRRIYAALSDQAGNYSYGQPTYVVTGATSISDGLANTNTLVAATSGTPYAAALSCRGLGTKWYVPSSNEIILLYTNKAVIGNFDIAGNYWTSTESGTNTGAHYFFSTGTLHGFATKNGGKKVRCVRRD